jgi:hypothetical protein
MSWSLEVAALQDELAALTAMQAPQLRAEWQRVCRSLPPAGGIDLLRRGIAYRMQERRFGGLSAATERTLAGVAANAGLAIASRTPEATLRVGTRLVRSWRGATYAVTVDDAGLVYAGRPYASLSAIAREITGVAWSGPRFFGLLKRTKTVRHA